MPKVDVDGPGLAETLFVLTEEILGLAVNDSARSRNKWRIFLVAPSARTRRLPSSWRKNETTTRLALENLTQSCHTSVSVVLFFFPGRGRRSASISFDSGHRPVGRFSILFRWRRPDSFFVSFNFPVVWRFETPRPPCDASTCRRNNRNDSAAIVFAVAVSTSVQ